MVQIYTLKPQKVYANSVCHEHMAWATSGTWTDVGGGSRDSKVCGEEAYDLSKQTLLVKSDLQ